MNSVLISIIFIIASIALIIRYYLIFDYLPKKRNFYHQKLYHKSFYGKRKKEAYVHHVDTKRKILKLVIFILPVVTKEVDTSVKQRLIISNISLYVIYISVFYAILYGILKN